jgi:Holliday junction resolvase RusA-like endonuclease
VTVIEFTVHGDAETQGSHTAVLPKGHTRPVVIPAGSKQKRQSFVDWRHDVATKAQEARDRSELTEPMGGPVDVTLHVGLAKKSTTPKLKRTWPIAARSGDVDKLARAVLDSITSVLVKDDSQVVRLVVTKDWADSPGAYVRVEPHRAAVAALVTETAAYDGQGALL